MTGLNYLPVKTKQKVMAIMTVILFCVFVLGWNIFIRPVLAKAALVRTERAAEVERQNLRSQIHASQSELGTYKSFYGANTSPSRFVDMLIQMANNNRVTILAATPSGETVKPYYRMINILLDLQVGWHDLGRFIAALESADPYIVVSDLKVNSPFEGAATAYGGSAQISVVTSFFLEN